MALTPYLENVNNSPYGLANTNAPGSPYAAAYDRGTTNHLYMPVDPVIFDCAPRQFLDLQFLMAYASEDMPGDEATWFEQVWGRVPLVFGADFAGVVLSAGISVTGTITLDAASTPFCYVDQKLTYGTSPNQTQAWVMSVNSGANTAVIRSQVGAALGAATAADLITNGMTGGGDGGSFFAAPTRATQVQKTNLMEKIGPEEAIWNELERIKWKNQSQTNYMEMDVNERRRQLKVSLCQRIWFGQYGETNLNDGRIIKTTEGIYNTIINNGGASIPATTATAWDAIIAGTFQTNFMAVDNERLVFGTPEMLTTLNMKQKAEFVRYRPEDNTYNNDFEQWKIGGQTLTLVPTQIWGDPASFPPEWKRRLVILQKQNTKLVTMRGTSMMQEGLTTQSRYNITPSEIYDFERFYIQGFVGTKTQNAASNFIVDIA